MFLSSIKRYVSWKFAAPDISTQELHSRLEKEKQDQGGQVLLLDNRSEAEFAVSRLGGAKNLPLRWGSVC